jgi:hypothetical protein
MKSVLEVDIKAVDELKVEKCTVALSQSESVRSLEDLDNSVLFLQEFLAPSPTSDSIIASPDFSSCESIPVRRTGVSSSYLYARSRV